MLKFLDNQYDKRKVKITQCEKIKEERSWYTTKLYPTWEITYNRIWISGLNIGDHNLFYLALRRKFLQQLIDRRGEVEVTIWSLCGSDIYLELDDKFYLYKENGPMLGAGIITAAVFSGAFIVEIIFHLADEKYYLGPM